MEKEKRLFLLDAYALIYRAYYAFIRNPRFNSKRQNTSAIFGFTNSLVEILVKEDPSHIAVVFDPSGPTFRNDLYEKYKENREETPEDIKFSIPYIKQIVKGFNIPVIEMEGYEADDVIGTLSYVAKSKDYKTYMITPDKDYCQLVDENVFIYKPKKSGSEIEVLGPEEVNARFNIKNPFQVIDILALMGDSSDNVPGAPGIGEKTAQKLISRFGSVENLLDQVDELKGKQKEIIENYKDQILLSKKLVTIKTDIVLGINPEDLIRAEIDKDQLTEVFNELEFNTISKRVLGVGTNQNTVQKSLFDDEVLNARVINKHSIDNTEHEYILVDDKQKRENLINVLNKQKEFCFDTETTGLDTFSAEIIGLAFSFKKGTAFYVPVPTGINEARIVLNEFKDVFENGNISKTGQNVKYDMLMLSSYGIVVKGTLFDTLLAHYLLQPDLKHNLNFIAEQYLNYTPVSIESLIGEKGKGQRTMKSVPLEKIVEYAGEDADITWQLKEILKKELEENKLIKLAEEIEMPLINVLCHMEISGFKINVEALADYAIKLKEELIGIEKEIIQLAGQEFNISSPKQLGDILFEKLGIDASAKMTKTKQYSTNEEVLAKLKDKHPIINLILEFRSLKKLLSTYVEALPKLINPVTKKVHTSYNQAVAVTGRLSSNKPNLQNIPIREERGREIRKAFIPSSSENILLSADYSQIELRLMAHVSNDQEMISAFTNDEDIHAATAAKIFGVSLEDVTKDMRSKAKTANFGIIYGISAFGLSQRLNISRNESSELINGYFNSYPDVKEYMNNSIRIAREKGYVQTLWGRKRYLPDINSRNAVVRGFAERNAINAPIQGSAADIIKIAMINIYKRMIEEKLSTKMILQVHDELIFDVPKHELGMVKKMVKHEMENAATLNVPLQVDVGVGENWLEAHD